MKIAVDIDDTLTESFDYFQPYIAEFFDADEKVLKEKNVSYANLPEEWKSREIAFCKAYYDRIVEYTPFKSNAVDGVRRLKELGHEIVILTGRSNAFYTDPYKTTRKELARGGIAYDELICALDKVAACRNAKIELLIDDLIPNCEAVNAVGVPALLFTSKANAGEQTLNRRINNWTEAVSAVKEIGRGYPSRKFAEELLKEAGEINDGGWVKHSRIVAACAEKIADAIGLNAERAYVSGLLHDIGRRFFVRDLGHIYNGYKYMRLLGFNAVSQVCLTHSFPNKNTRLYIGKIDVSEDQEKELKTALEKTVYDEYDELIQLCDALAGSEGILDIEERMADVKRRYGFYSDEQWNKNLELKARFEKKLGLSIYVFLSDLRF